MHYADVEQLGRVQSLLPNGSLLARDVPIARVGIQAYHASELPPDAAGAADATGMVNVLRSEHDVFEPRSMASFEGVPVVMQHPEMVDPHSWRDVAVGHCQNVRRDGDYLIADLLIHDAGAIDAIRNQNWRGVSCGYSADYEPISGGMRQTGITANHVAVLPSDQLPRCGPSCAIGDRAYRGDINMQDHNTGAGGIRWWGADQEGGKMTFRPPFTSPMGTSPDPRKVGPTPILELHGPLTSYILLPIGTDRCGLFRSSDIDAKLDVGKTHGTADAMTADAMRAARQRVASDQARNRKYASDVAAWWAAHQAKANV